MIGIHHLLCGRLHAPPNPAAVCHCLLLEDPGGLALVDTGIGLLDVMDPVGRLGREVIDGAGFLFDGADTAAQRIRDLGLEPSDVAHVVLTHADPDHTGGLADFPDAWVHLSEEELGAVEQGRPRYAASHFAHGPAWQAYGSHGGTWFGLDARPVALGFGSTVLLVALPGHTVGHCGVAIQQGDRWLLHVGDAYYLRGELERDDHPVSALATLRADDDPRRRASLAELRRLAREQAGKIELIGYHDPDELPAPGFETLSDAGRGARR